MLLKCNGSFCRDRRDSEVINVFSRHFFFCWPHHFTKSPMYSNSAHSFEHKVEKNFIDTENVQGISVEHAENRLSLQKRDRYNYSAIRVDHKAIRRKANHSDRFWFENVTVEYKEGGKSVKMTSDFLNNRFLEHYAVNAPISKLFGHTTLRLDSFSFMLIIWISSQTHIYTFHFHFHCICPQCNDILGSPHSLRLHRLRLEVYAVEFLHVCNACHSLEQMRHIK